MVEDQLKKLKEELKASYPQYTYTTENPPPKDPLVAVTELAKRRQKWFNENFGESP